MPVLSCAGHNRGFLWLCPLRKTFGAFVQLWIDTSWRKRGSLKSFSKARCLLHVHMRNLDFAVKAFRVEECRSVFGVARS